MAKSKKTSAKKKLVPKVASLVGLRLLAHTDERYARLMAVASSNLGGPSEPLSECFRWLSVNADETSEEGVMGEVNNCRDLL